MMNKSIAHAGRHMIVTWIETSITALFSRASIKFIIETPDWKPLGASMVTTFTSLTCALAALWAVFRLWRIFPPAITFFRNLLICGLVFLISGELSCDEFAFAKSVVTFGKIPAVDGDGGP